MYQARAGLTFHTDTGRQSPVQHRRSVGVENRFTTAGVGEAIPILSDPLEA